MILKNKTVLTINQSHNLLDEIIEYLNNVTSNNQYDIVVCIERRGLVLYNDARNNLENKIDFYSEKAIDRLEITGKTILLFDDSINSGIHAATIRKKLLFRGASKVDIATYLKIKTCNYETLEPKYSTVYIDGKTIELLIFDM